MNVNNKTATIVVGLAILIAITPAVSALQDPYPLYGYVVDDLGTPMEGANVTFTNQNTGEVIYDITSASGWYMDDAGNFPSGYQNGQTIKYDVKYGNYTTTVWHVINSSVGSHTINVTIHTILDSDHDGVPDAWDEEPNTPVGAWTDSQGRGRMLGDMNGDGKLSSVDALMILQWAVRC